MSNIISNVCCNNYQYENVKKALYKVLDGLGGIHKFIQKNDKVLLKANLLMRTDYNNAVTTHPMIVRCMAEILKKECDAKVIIGDCPGGEFNHKVMSAIYQVTGMEQVAEETGALLNWDFGERTLSHNGGLLLKKVQIANFVSSVDKIISMPKLKTHSMMTYSGAVKNMFGIIPGITKAEYHMHMSKYNQFADVLIDICLLGKPTLSIMDAVVSMEGNGPSAGEKKHTNLIIAAENPFHLDKYCCHIIGFPVHKVPTVERSIARGLTKQDMSDLLIVGEKNVSLKPFRMPDSISNNYIKTDKFDKEYVNENIKAKLICDHNKCVKCLVCKNSCPAKAISLQNNQITFDMDRCIRCYCCQELCSFKAIKIRRSYLLKALLKDHEW